MREELEAVREALLIYQRADDGAVSMLKGFAATGDDVDRSSPARHAITTLDKLIAAQPLSDEARGD